MHNLRKLKTFHTHKTFFGNLKKVAFLFSHFSDSGVAVYVCPKCGRTRGYIKKRKRIKRFF